MAAPAALALPSVRAPSPGTSDVLESLLGIGVTTTFRGGQTIVLEGDPLVHCYRVISGTVRLFKSIADGRRQVIDFAEASDAFGLVGQTRYGFSAEAVGPATLSRHNRRHLGGVVMGDPQAAAGLLDLACLELERARAHMLLLGRRSAEEKVVCFLLSYAARTAGRFAGEGVVHLPFSRQDLADHLGLTIETVSRTFSQLNRQGLIALLTPQHIALLRPGPLARIAEGR